MEPGVIKKKQRGESFLVGFIIFLIVFVSRHCSCRAFILFAVGICFSYGEMGEVEVLYGCLKYACAHNKYAFNKY